MKYRFQYMTFFLVFFFCFTFVFSNNASLDSLKNKNYITFEDIALPLVTELRLSEASTSTSDAISILLTNFPKLKNISHDSYLCYDDISLIAMQIWDLSGGFFYSILQNKHYSFRELQYKGFISNDIDPMKQISGKEAFNLLFAISQN